MDRDTKPPVQAHDDKLVVVGIAASAGGLKALLHVLSDLSADLPAALVVVQHLSPNHPSYLVEILQRRVRLQVKQVQKLDLLRAGTVLVAPPNRHVVVGPGGKLRLTESEQVRFVRPSADVLFESLAENFGSRALAVILTGSGTDGADGVRAVKAAGGTVIVQDRATSEHYAMPEAAILTGSVDAVLPLEEIAAWIIDYVTRETHS